MELNWKRIKDIHKRRLKERFSQPHIGNPKLLAVDEISLKKRHKYLTVVIDWESGRVMWISEGRGEESLEGFFSQLTPEVKRSIKAVAMDMWDPYIKAVKEHCPGCAIVFDQFYVVSSFGRVIDKVRNIEFRKANQMGIEVIKGSKYILLKNPENLFSAKGRSASGGKAYGFPDIEYFSLIIKCTFNK